ncbi:MAG: YCF48-related protein [Bacteroidales bacterium]|jgi:photosystem II stability/assembly factor-like uncharacterized protein|nr:YCF48-related protein [Bacteroidales bacterium]
MKKLTLLFTFSFCLYTFVFPQQYGWTDISANLPEYSNYNDVHVIGDEIWITGWNDGLIYTPDGGETFQIQTLPENSGISSSVFMKNNQDGYVVTFNGKILKTDDGGTNWYLLHDPGGTLNSVHFPPSSSTGYTCGENGKVYSFSNTAFDIADISPAGIVSSLQSISFPVDTSEGKLCGQNIIRRYLSGSWDNLQFFDNGFLYNSIFFTDNSTGWVVGSHGKLFKTIDGLSWLPQTSNTTSNLNDVFFIDSMIGWAAGSGVLLHTVDGGLNWTQELTIQTEGKELRAIYFISPHNGYVVGNDVVLKYGIISGMSNGVEAVPFEIFPNPASSVVKLARMGLQSTVFSQQSTVVEIYDLHGRKLLEKHFPAGTEEIEVDVSNLASGVYGCRLSTENKSVTKKIIVK